MRLSITILLAMFLAVSPALATPQEDFAKGQAAYWAGNYKDAAKWVRKAAEQGMAKAQTILGRMYRDGQGVVKNDKEAVKWFHQAAAQGDADAQYRLGRMYDEGLGVIKNDKEAVKWWHLAAEQGYAPAQGSLSANYASGQGVVRNFETAYMFTLLALVYSENENEREAIEEWIVLIEKELTTAQRQSGQEAAAEYQRKIEARY